MYSFEKMYVIGEGVNARVLSRWTPEELEAVADAILEAIDMPDRTPVGEDEERAHEIVSKYGKDAALAFAREIFADVRGLPTVPTDRRK